jgi:hypothetical protein
MLITTPTFLRTWIQTDPLWSSNSIAADIAYTLQIAFYTKEPLNFMIQNAFPIAYDPVDREYYEDRKDMYYKDLLIPPDTFTVTKREITNIFLSYGPQLPYGIRASIESTNPNYPDLLSKLKAQLIQMQQGIGWIMLLLDPQFAGKNRLSFYIEDEAFLRIIERQLLILQEAMEYNQRMLQMAYENIKEYIQS